MNRLVPAHGCRVVCVGLAWMLAASDVSAQNSSPSVPATPSFATTGFGTGSCQALHPASKSLLKSATRLPTRTTTRRYSPSGWQLNSPRLRRSTPAPSKSFGHSCRESASTPPCWRCPPPRVDCPCSGLARWTEPSRFPRPTWQPPRARKREALRLVAIGRAALDRGDITHRIDDCETGRVAEGS